MKLQLNVDNFDLSSIAHTRKFSESGSIISIAPEDTNKVIELLKNQSSSNCSKLSDCITSLYSYIEKSDNKDAMKLYNDLMDKI